MKGLQGKELEALKRFVELKKTKHEVTPKDIGQEKAKILTRIWKDYGKGFIACEMRRIIDQNV